MDEEMLKDGPADALRELISVGVKAELKRKNDAEKNPDVKMQPAEDDDEDPIESCSSPDDVRAAAEKAVGELATTRKKPRSTTSTAMSSRATASSSTKNEKSPESPESAPIGKGKGQRSLTEWAKGSVAHRAPETWAQRMQKWEAPVSKKDQKGEKPRKGGKNGA